MDTIPPPLVAAGITRVRALDLRPVFDLGGEPFPTIMDAVDALGELEALHLIVPFEPRPLYRVLGMRGFASHTEERDGLFHVWFYRGFTTVTPPSI